MSNSKHDKIKDDLSDDYTKGSDNYPQTRSQALMLMVIIPRLQLPSPPQRARRLLRVIRRRRRVATRKRNLMPPRIPKTLIRIGGRTRSATGAARRDILPQRALSNCSAIMTISQLAHPSWPAMQ
jgi:hypothetical protein